jgi:hypothetical protein
MIVLNHRNYNIECNETHGTGQLGDVKTPNSLPNVSSNIIHSHPALTAFTITEQWTIKVHNKRNM